MSEHCCARCFGDRGLARHIIPSLDPVIGVCSFCGQANASTVKPNRLVDVFTMLLNTYEVDQSHGRGLVDLLREDWGLFSAVPLDAAHAKELLAEIFDDGELVRKKFSQRQADAGVGLAVWDKLRDELMYRNRYFLDEGIDRERLKELLGHLIASPADIPASWYRARIVGDDTAFTADQMGAPPRRLATHGRANPAGIPYLYLGSLPDTAVAEIRPHTGERACVAEFTFSSPITLIDLRDPKNAVSPFLLADSGAIAQLRSDIPFLQRLGEELTRPVLPRSAAIDYLPSQYLCEFIKKSGYDGVLYRSSVSNGMNLALFYPEKAQAGGISLFDIKRVSVDIDPCTAVPHTGTLPAR